MEFKGEHKQAKGLCSQPKALGYNRDRSLARAKNIRKSKLFTPFHGGAHSRLNYILHIASYSLGHSELTRPTAKFRVY